MNKIIRGIALTTAAVTLFATTAFAATIPVRETFEKEGFTVSWDQDRMTVVITKDSFTASEPVGDNITLDYDKTYTTEEFVNSVYAAYQKELLSTTATVTEVGEGYFTANTEKLGEVIFMTDDKTAFRHEMNRRLYTFSDIEAGAKLKVYFGETMTASIPPQTLATEVIFLKDTEDTADGKTAQPALTQNFVATEVGEGFFMAENETLGEVMFLTDDNTTFRHEMNRRRYFLTDIEKGTALQVTFSDAMTASIPPQTLATEVVFLKSAEDEALINAVTSGKITEVGEDYFVINSENGEIQFNVSEETIIRHNKNKMLYKIDALEKDMEVEVTHTDSATLSLPPQMNALNVTIK